MKFDFIIVALVMVSGVALLMVSGEISTEEISPAIEHSSSLPQSETEMSPSPTMSNDYDYPSSSQLTESNDLNYTDSTRPGGEEASVGGENGGGGGKKTGIAVVGSIAAASMVGFGGYVLKKRRENIRRSRYGYASTEFF
ncbi:hypothetical protein AtNW77_Chr5g0146961 [Arabidopsis thaliana]|jgi:hypothetical protein|uniref:At5g60630 n=4 Tax=Arabidopsis TaxID=3701 RepID=Q9FF56_ARATH|nr:uncharacterized protein AT5G60630 [Arabidopsis thaliana]KAG7606797.1 hypothetical protein ISN45_At05g056710 [Arabidopsis thaliana x Arabidopsis arenosa]KAG7613710.1 hypothetical protein ISN44_As05g055900 [Arabidopsis suecica]AAV84517.1 At5g60630 [Arabidopsis thaliana]AAW38972.1 At5g60630 [Arabidopsis thaliana]ABR46225.1 At5g60630 [Arabidopsis thaliana]|eukprot:NP_200871.1 transmembrane protein [Arabidopsis thaliana]